MPLRAPPEPLPERGGRSDRRSCSTNSTDVSVLHRRARAACRMARSDVTTATRPASVTCSIISTRMVSAVRRSLKRVRTAPVCIWASSPPPGLGPSNTTVASRPRCRAQRSTTTTTCCLPMAASGPRARIACQTLLPSMRTLPGIALILAHEDGFAAAGSGWPSGPWPVCAILNGEPCTLHPSVGP